MAFTSVVMRTDSYGGTRDDIKGGDKAKALSNISVRNPQLLVSIPPLQVLDYLVVECNELNNIPSVSLG
jgi:hypothetical protein